MDQEQSIVQYGTFTLDALTRDQQLLDELSERVYIEVEQGDNIYRFLPPRLGMQSPFRMTAQHFIQSVPGLEGKTISFACPRHELREPCVACDKAQEMLQSANPNDRELARSLAAKPRIYANVVPRHRDPAVYIYAFGPTVMGALQSIRKKAHIGGDFTNPGPQGFDICVTRNGTGQQTRYVITPVRECSPLHADPAVIAMLLSQQHDLDACVVPVVPEELLNIWNTVTMQVPRNMPQRAAYPARNPAPPASAQARQQPTTVNAVGRTIMDDIACSGASGPPGAPVDENDDPWRD